METNLAFDETEVELKRCPRCELWLPLSEFGVCNARPDKMNLYDRKCIRQKIALSRQNLREYKQARGKHNSSTGADYSRVTIDNKTSLSARRIARMLRKLSPEDRVREAIRSGANTLDEIVSATKLPKDECTDYIANLLLWSRSITTRMIRHQRMYFINEAPGTIMREPIRPEREPRSFGVSTIYEAGDLDIRGMSTKYLRNKVG